MYLVIFFLKKKKTKITKENKQNLRSIFNSNYKFPFSKTDTSNKNLKSFGNIQY